MRSWSTVTFVWLSGCVLWLAGCFGPSAHEVQTHDETSPDPIAATQAVHHAPQKVRPVLTWRENPSPSVPLALTASDGSGLDLVSMKARVVIQDPLALTELHLTFDNPEGRRREGRFEIELPPGAALSRLSMRIGDRWQEGEVVERGHARRTYETFLHERPRVDPALLEHDTGNRIRARVFPILPHERKEIVVSFSQPLGHAPYVLPLQGLSTIEQFDARVVVHTHDDTAEDSSLSGRQSARRVVELRRENFTPEQDLLVELGGTAEAAGVHAGELVAVRLRPRASRPTAPLESLLVLFDTSASAHVGFEDRIERLGQVVEQLATHGDFRLRVVGFDQRTTTVFEGTASRFHIDVLADLAEAKALGASNLEAAIAEATQSTLEFERVLLVSDGIPTAGETDRGALRKAARTLESIGVQRLDALASTARGDKERLDELTTALPQPGAILNERHNASQIAHGMRQAPFGDVSITVDGAAWSWPASLRGVQPGDDVLVYARYQHTRPPAMRVEFSDPSIPTQLVHTVEADAPLVERGWAQARIDRIEHELTRLGPDADASRRQLGQRIVQLSTHYRVLNDRTALLVLETEADYRQFGISRRGRADILTIDEGSIRVQSESVGRPQLSVFDDLLAISKDTGDGLAPDPEVVARNQGVLGVMAGEEGQMGRPQPNPARDANGLFAMAQESGHFLASPYGGAFAVGNDDSDVWGGLSGTEVGEAFGTAGLGLVGAGRGGGGTGEGTIGLGNTALIGKGSGGSSGTGQGYGRGAGVAPSTGWVGRSGFGRRGSPVARVRMQKAQVRGSLDRDIVRRIVRAHINELRHCYNLGLVRDPSLSGTAVLQFLVSATGTVPSATIERHTLGDESVRACMAKAVRRWKFPRPSDGATVQVSMPVQFGVDGVAVARSTPRRRTSRRWRGTTRRRAPKAAHSGQYSAVHKALTEGRVEDARSLSWDWVRSQPGDVLALLALGESLERGQRPRLAARVYGSIIDLHPSRPELRRAAGERLERLDDSDALALAVDTYEKAAALRPDQPSGPRLHAWALVRQQDYAAAFDVLSGAVERRYPWGRFAGVHTLLRQDLNLVASAWLASTQGDARREAEIAIATAGVIPDNAASVRLVVTWETDTTDVDVLPRNGGRGGLLGHRLADVRTGFGPEARVIRGKAIPAQLHAAVRYFDRGAMGHAMGTLHVISHDGLGQLKVESKPFVLMQQRGVLDMGTFDTTS